MHRQDSGTTLNFVEVEFGFERGRGTQQVDSQLRFWREKRLRPIKVKRRLDQIFVNGDKAAVEKSLL